MADALEQPVDAAQALDMLAIQQCLGRAVLGNDLLDIALWKSAYWPDATEDHGWYVGNAHQFIDETLVMLERDMDTTWHALGVTTSSSTKLWSCWSETWTRPGMRSACL